MKRSSRLTRSAPMTRGGRPKAKKRSASEKLRIYGPEERIAWMKRQPCLALKRPEHQCFGAIECAHTESGGVGRKADASTIVPLCVAAHRLVHTIGQRSFEIQFGLDLKAEAARIDAAWQAHTHPTEAA